MLFPVRDGIRHSRKMTRYGVADWPFKGQNPAYGALVTYYLKEKPGKDTKVALEVLDAKGTVIRTVKKPPAEAGLNRAAWDLAYDLPRPRKDPEKEEEEGDSEFGPPNRGPQVLPGTYRVRLTVGESVVEQSVGVRVDPTVAVSAADLQAQFDMALKLHEMRVEMHEALRGLDALKLQLDERKKLAGTARKDAPAEWKKGLDAKVEALDAFVATLTRPAGKPFWSEGPRLTERLAGLAGGVDDGNRRPTAAEVAYFEELRAEMSQGPGRDRAIHRRGRGRNQQAARGPGPAAPPRPREGHAMKNALTAVVIVVALEHVWFLVLEMFLWTKPIGLKTFRKSPEFARESAALAANQGLYNGFLVAGLLWGLLHPDPLVGRADPDLLPRLRRRGRHLRWAHGFEAHPLPAGRFRRSWGWAWPSRAERTGEVGLAFCTRGG